MHNKLTLLVQLWLKDGNVTGFEAFEGKAATIMAMHGGTIERVIRLDGSDPAAPFEVHWVSFPDEQAFAAYRADPAVLALAQERAAVIERTVVWYGVAVASYGLQE
ncbi:MAG: hypothetical protein U0175_28545 [Caldilineaceae bacterium]